LTPVHSGISELRTKLDGEACGFAKQKGSRKDHRNVNSLLGVVQPGNCLRIEWRRSLKTIARRLFPLLGSVNAAQTW
jgi:hypothetical protein